MQSIDCSGLFDAAASLETIESALDALVADGDTEFGAHVLGDGTVTYAP
jgi:hypothetical protein